MKFSTRALFLSFTSLLILILGRNILPEGFFYDSWTNIWAVPVASFLFIYLKQILKILIQIKICFFTTLGFVLYEFTQKILPWTTFDIKDIYASFIGFSLTVIIILIAYLLRKHIESQETRNFIN